MNFNLKNYKAGIFIPFVVILAASLTILHQAFLAPVFSTIKSEQVKMIIEFIGVLSVPGLLGLILVSIDKWLWKFLPFLVKIPNISGRYEGVLISNFQDPKTGLGKEMNVAVEIKQSASTLFVSAYFQEPWGNPSSSSTSLITELSKGGDGFYTLFYSYSNEGSKSDVNLHRHQGFVELKYFLQEKRLAGHYFSERSVGGTIDVVRRSKRLSGRF